MDLSRGGMIFAWILIGEATFSNGSSSGGRDFRMNLGRGAGFSGGFWSGVGAALAAKFPSVVPRGGWLRLRVA